MKITDKIASWIRSEVENARARGTVFGLSGGLDSSVVGALCKNACGEETLGVIMPCGSSSEDVEDAMLAANAFSIPTVTVPLDEVIEKLMEVLPKVTSPLSLANLKPRLRMVVLYYFANERNYLVVGTGNRSEISVGYFTKHGDGAADILPLAKIYKSEVYGLAEELSVPRKIIEKPPSAGLWEAQTDEDELGMTYWQLDGILKSIHSGKMPKADENLVKRVQEMIKRSEHKRSLPPMFDPWE
ncbi:MAG: NAD(+) synthase [Actinomycetota bacterium]|nr:NAD(+) synthase [Actinomycetota bacterium]